MAQADETWSEFCRRSLRAWAGTHGVPDGDLVRVDHALRDAGRRRRVEAGDQQCPDLYVEGLAASPWHAPERFPWAHTIEAQAGVIREELDAILAHDGTVEHPEAAALSAPGRWRRFDLLKARLPVAEARRRCPRTLELLRRLPELWDYGAAYFAVLLPGSRVQPHYGPVNTRLRCHLGLRVPEGCGIRVGTETRCWEEGRCIVFDDSYDHEVWNSSDVPRVVLIGDVWHPDLTPVERAALAYLIRDLPLVFPATAQLARAPAFVGGAGVDD